MVVLAGIGAYLFFTRTRPKTRPPPPRPEEARKLIDIKPEDVQKTGDRSRIGQAAGFRAVGQRLEDDRADSDRRPRVSKWTTWFATSSGMQSREQEDAGKKSALGLDHPAYTIEVTSKDKKTVKLQVGGEAATGRHAAVLLDGNQKPNIVNVSIYSRLEKKPETYRRTRLLTVSTDQVRQLTISHKGQTIRLEKTGNDWQIVEPKKMPADSTAVSDLLFGISGLTARKFPSGYSTADAGLVKPREVIRYSLEAPTTSPATSPSTRPSSTEIKLGGYEDVTRDNIFAQVDDGPIATVAASTFDTFNKAPLDLRDKKALDLDPERVESIKIQIDRPATTQPTTRPAANRTFTIARPSEAQKSAATSQPTSGPTTSVASTQPAPATQPLAKWIFISGGEGNADEGQVTAL